MDLSQNKNSTPTYKETLRDRLMKRAATAVVLGALIGAVYEAHDSHPPKTHVPTYLETHQGINPADIIPNNSGQK